MNSVKSIVLILLVASIACSTASAAREHRRHRGHKNVIVLVPDGCDQSVHTAARWYKEYALNDDTPMAMDEMGTSGMVKTYMANSIITGSAAAATAFATGEKTTVRFLGVGPDPDHKANLTGFESDIAPYAPIETVLEAARKSGKSTGLISTSRITHATPAAYGCHIADRGWDNEIMEHLVYQDIDVVFGGGARHLIPSDDSYVTSFGDTWGGKRTDGENLMDVLAARGYQFVDNKTDLATVSGGKVWGMFDDSHMDPELDRDDLHPSQPSIAEMTEKAIEVLSQDKDGFFIMIEGSQIDWAGHANDPVYMITDHLAFDDAVRAALDYAKKDKDTLVLVFPDHNTGAMSIGHQQGSGAPSYTETTIEDMIDPIKDATITVQTLVGTYAGTTDANDVIDSFVAYWGDFWNSMTIEQAEEIMAMGGNSYGVAEYISKTFTVFGWTTHGHTGEDVPLWSYSRDSSECPVGTFDNTDMATICADFLNVRLRGSDAWITFDVDGTNVTIDETDPANLVAIVYGVRFPVGKDIVEVHGWEKNLEYVTVYDDVNGKVYIPKK